MSTKCTVELLFLFIDSKLRSLTLTKPTGVWYDFVFVCHTFTLFVVVCFL